MALRKDSLPSNIRATKLYSKVLGDVEFQTYLALYPKEELTFMQLVGGTFLPTNQQV